MRESGTELLELVVAYAKQETLDPLRSLGRYLLWGMAGAIAMSIGTLLTVLAVVRLLQTEVGHHLSGNLTWVPYMGGLLVAVLVVGLAGMRAMRRSR